jgi:hypothetical protein
VHTGFWCGDPKVRVHLEDLEVDRMIILIWVFKNWDEESWIGLIWLRIWTVVELL